MNLPIFVDATTQIRNAMSRYVFLILVTSLLMTLHAYAGDEQYTVSGAGYATCDMWIEGRSLVDKDIDSMFVSWLQGFLSGMNSMRSVTTNQKMSLIPDGPTLLAYVDKQCRDNPSDRIYSISLKLYFSIAPTEQAEKLTFQEVKKVCESQADLAESVMWSRQKGTPMSQVMEGIRGNSSKSIIAAAYNEPVQPTQELRDKTIENFPNKVARDCFNNAPLN